MKDILVSERRLLGGGKRSASVVVTLTGLAEGYAEIGGTPVGFSTNLGQAPDGGVAWSSDPDPQGGAAYGTAFSPGDFSAGDGAILYLHLTHQGQTFTRAAAIRQSVAPLVTGQPSVTGTAIEGLTLSGVAGTISGPGVSILTRWQSSTNGTTGWAVTGPAGLTSPVLVLGRHYRLVSTASNTRGTAQSVSAVVGPVAEAPTAPEIQSIAIGAYTQATGLPITVTATNVVAGDTVHWVLVPDAEATPTASEVLAGQAATAGSPVDHGSGIWPGPFNDTLVAGIALDSYKLCVVISGAELSDVAVSAPFDLQTPTELALPADFGIKLFRDTEGYIPEHADGAHELAAFTGTTHFVDAGQGSDVSGDGSSGNPYATLAHCIALAADFDRILLKPGIYATPVSHVSTSVALLRDGASGTVLIGRFDDLSTAQVDPTDVAPPSGATQRLWNVDDIGGETFGGFVRLDGAAPGGMRGCAQSRTNALCAQYQSDGVACVFYGGTSANFATGTADSLPDLISGGHIRAWVLEETQRLTIAATVYVGSDIIIANNAVDAVEVVNGGLLVLDGCEVYGGSDSTVAVTVGGRLRAFAATISGSSNDNIHYSNGSLGTEVGIKCLWPGHDETDNTSTAHGNAKVLRVNGEYAGGSRCIHDIDLTEIINVGLRLRDALFFDQTLMQIGVGGGDTAQLTYGDVTFTGTYANSLVIDPGCTATRADSTDPWPYS